MAKTWISTAKFYREISNVSYNLKMPNLTIEEQQSLYPQIIGSIAHSDFKSNMDEYIGELQFAEDERDIDNDIRVSHGDWFDRAATIRLFMSQYLAEWITAQPILPDTYFIQKKTISSVEWTRNQDGSVELVIHNEGDQWPIRRSYSVKQRFLIYKFLESITDSFEQVDANLRADSGKKKTYEAIDLLTAPFKNGDDATLNSLLEGRSYYVLKYCIGVEDTKRKFYTHRLVSGEVSALKEDFFRSVEQGYVPKFNPESITRPRVPPVKESSYTRKQKRLPDGTLNIHIWDSVGVVEIRPKGAKSKETFPLCAIILPDGQLLMRNQFESQELIEKVLNR